jgi:hypothetical protein
MQVCEDSTDLAPAGVTCGVWRARSCRLGRDRRASSEAAWFRQVQQSPLVGRQQRDGGVEILMKRPAKYWESQNRSVEARGAVPRVFMTHPCFEGDV